MGLLMKSPSAGIGGMVLDKLRNKKKPAAPATTPAATPRRVRGGGPAVGALMGGGAGNAVR